MAMEEARMDRVQRIAQRAKARRQRRKTTPSPATVLDGPAAALQRVVAPARALRVAPESSQAFNRRMQGCLEAVRVAREELRAYRASYRAADNERARHPLFQAGAQFHVDSYTRFIVRELSRHLYRNSGLYKTMIIRSATMLVGTGVEARFLSGSPQWSADAGDRHHRACQRIDGGLDSREEAAWYVRQRQLAVQVLRDGEGAVLNLADGRRQIIEPEQIVMRADDAPQGSPFLGNHLDGIELDAAGHIRRVWIAPYDDGGSVQRSRAKAYPGSAVDFFAITDRASQVRGMPLLTPDGDDLERIDSMLEAEIQAGEQAATIWSVLTLPPDQQGLAPTGFSSLTPGPSGPYDSDQQLDWQEVAGGMMFQTPQGGDLKPFHAQRPALNVPEFIKQCLRMTCASFELPYELIFYDLAAMSWSVHKGLIAQARPAIEAMQSEWFGAGFLRQAQRWLDQAMRGREVPARDDYHIEMEWPALPVPDDEREWAGHITGIDRGLTSRHRAVGQGWRRPLDELAEELDYAATLSIAYNKKFAEHGFRVDPSFFLGAASNATSGGPTGVDADDSLTTETETAGQESAPGS